MAEPQMVEFHIECRCGFRSSSNHWGRVSKESNAVCLPALILSSGELVAKQLLLDQPPLCEFRHDRLGFAEWMREDGPALMAREFGDSAVLVGPQSIAITCPRCREESARGVLDRWS